MIIPKEAQRTCDKNVAKLHDENTQQTRNKSEHPQMNKEYLQKVNSKHHIDSKNKNGMLLLLRDVCFQHFFFVSFFFNLIMVKTLNRKLSS